MGNITSAKCLFSARKSILNFQTDFRLEEEERRKKKKRQLRKYRHRKHPAHPPSTRAHTEMPPTLLAQPGLPEWALPERPSAEEGAAGILPETQPSHICAHTGTHIPIHRNRMKRPPFSVSFLIPFI